MLEQYSVSGHEFSLETSENVFIPTSTTRKLAENMVIPPGSVVLDLGCGTGPIAILAAKMGAGHVYAVDVMQGACKLAAENAARNGLADKITIRCGSLFEPVKDLSFDVIVDDVSGVADRAARLSPWFPPDVPTGGEDGTELIVTVLSEARHHLNPGGKIYWPVISLSDAKKIERKAQEFFDHTARCVASYRIPLCKELLDAIDELEELKARGLVDFEKRGSRYTWTLEIWEAVHRAS